MQYFAIETDWDASLNSQWDALWHEGEHFALNCLDGSLPLEAIWKSPPIALESRSKTPDVYSFELHYAVNERTLRLPAPIVKEEAEFLPLSIANQHTAYVIHPLWPVDFDKEADVQCNAVSKNITVVHKYSFTLDPNDYDGPRHLFRMRQARDSAARDHGCTMSTLIVSERVKGRFAKKTLSKESHSSPFMQRPPRNDEPARVELFSAATEVAVPPKP